MSELCKSSKAVVLDVIELSKELQIGKSVFFKRSEKWKMSEWVWNEMVKKNGDQDTVIANTAGCAVTLKNLTYDNLTLAQSSFVLGLFGR